MANSIANPSRVYISSNDRDPDQSPADFTVTLPATIENASSFEVVSFAFPNVFFPFGEDESVLYFAIRNSALQYVFFALNLGLEPLTDLELSPIPASAYAGGTLLNAGGSGYFRIFPNGLQGPSPALAPGAQTRIPVNNRAFANGQDFADYLQALIQSIQSTELVDGSNSSVSVQAVAAFSALCGGATPNTLTQVDFDGYQTMIPSPLTTNGTFRLVMYRNDPRAAPNNYTGLVILGSVDGAGNIRPFNMNVKLGYTDLVDTSPVTVNAYEYALNPINLTRTQDVYVASSLTSAESLATGGRRDILFKIPLTVGFGGIVSFQTTLQNTAENRLPNLIRTIEIVLLDDNFDPLVLPDNAVVSAELHFKFDLTPRWQGASSLR